MHLPNDSNTPITDRQDHDSGHDTPTTPHRDGGHGTLIIDRCFGRVGRIKRASGTMDPDVLRAIKAKMVTLFQAGRIEPLVAVRDRQLHPLDLLGLEGRPVKRVSSALVAPIRLYIMRATPSGNLKIGITRHVDKRLQHIRSANYEAIELIKSVPATPQRERAVHAAFAGHRIRGEWFRPTPEILEWVKRLGRVVVTP